MTDTAPEARRWPGETLRASGISRSFEGVHALNGVSIELHRHEVVGLIGPNGAGKTTLVNIVTGFDSPTEGEVELAGESITSWAPHRRARAGLARTYQHGRLFSGLSARENVEVAALGTGASPGEAQAAGGRAPRPARARAPCGLAGGRPPPRRGAKARGRARLGHRSALRAHGRAGGGPLRGRGAGLRRGRADACAKSARRGCS